MPYESRVFMLSICIPIYNFEVTPLVTELEKQMQLLKEPIELILIDDCSKPEFKEKNKNICKHFTYIELTKNIGRSSIRNLFLKYASNDFLLFLDCDSLVASPDFLTSYLSYIKQGNNVICGGRIYPNEKPAKAYRLRWKYGKYRESQPSTVRGIRPYQSFLTNNFVVKKKVLSDIKFDESLKDYGHEDTLFGFELKKQNIPIAHIDNPILNGDLELNTDFILNTEKGIKNLVKITYKLASNSEFINDVRLLRTYDRLKFIRPIIRLSFFLTNRLMEKVLIAGYANLTLFSFYKLGLLDKEIRSDTN